MRRFFGLFSALVQSGHIQFTSRGMRITTGNGSRYNRRRGGPWAPDPSPRIDNTIAGKIAIGITVFLFLSVIGFMIWSAIVMNV